MSGPAYRQAGKPDNDKTVFIHRLLLIFTAMYKSYALIAFLILISIFKFDVSGATTENIDFAETALILDPAEDFFVSLRNREFKTAWDLLSNKSHDTIIDDVYKNSIERGIEIKRVDVMRDFQNSGIIFKNYWNAFIMNFDPDIVLNKRVWEFEKIESDQAVILLKARIVTKLHMYKEENHWKVGLVESFWTGKNNKAIKFMHSLLAIFL